MSGDPAGELAKRLLALVEGFPSRTRDEAFARVVAVGMRDYDSPTIAAGVFRERVLSVLVDLGH